MRPLAILLCLSFVLVPRAKAQAPLLVESFDSGMVAGAAPVGWRIEQPYRTGVSVSSDVFAEASSPNALALRDDSPLGRAEAHHDLSAEVGAGRLSVRVRVDSAAHAPAGVQLRSRRDGFLVALLLSEDGHVGYDVGSGTVRSDATWVPGAWTTLSVQWFSDGTFDAFVGAQRFVHRVPLALRLLPSRVVLTSGYGESTGQRAFFDDVAASAIGDSIDFESGPTNAPLNGLWVSAPPGTSARIISEAGTRVLELTDQNADARPTVVRTFAPVPEGSASVDVRIATRAQAPFDLQLLSRDHAFLLALRLGDDGMVAYNNHPRGEGSFTATGLSWRASERQDLRVDWTGQDRFHAYLNGVAFAEDQPLAIPGDPAEVTLNVGTQAGVGQRVTLDNLVIGREPVDTVRGRYRENALWLAHCYVNTAACLEALPALLVKLDRYYQVQTLFLNVGMLRPDGSLSNPDATLRLLPSFFAALRSHELAGGRRFHVVAWLNGMLDLGQAGAVNLAVAEVRARIARESTRLVSAEAEGSYVAATARTFDGVQLDLEPSGPSPAQRAGFVALLKDIRVSWAEVEADDRDLGLATHALASGTPASGSEWGWTPQAFYELGALVDHLAVMGYTVGIQNAPTYRAWIEAQTRDILRAVSGRYFNDSAHPRHSKAARVFMGLPAIGECTHHDPEAENISWGAPGIDRAISGMIAGGDLSVSSFGGAAVYLHFDGYQSGYATFATDWWWLGRHWLGAW